MQRVDDGPGPEGVAPSSASVDPALPSSHIAAADLRPLAANVGKTARTRPPRAARERGLITHRRDSPLRPPGSARSLALSQQERSAA